MHPDNPLYMFYDPASKGWSGSRFCLFVVNVMGIAAAAILLWRGQDPTILLTGLAATDATVYAVSTHKE
jgi:hypothetical protein